MPPETAFTLTPMSQTTVPAKQLSATLELNLNLTLGSGNGLSQIELMVEAITNHRDYYFRQMFHEIKNGEYENAHSYYKNYKDLSYLLDQLLLDVADLAYNNYGAATYKGDAQAHSKQVESRAGLRKESYKEFLELIMCVTPDETE